MKIYPVCNNKYNNFRGLWNISEQADKAEYRYYPFGDETKEQIKQSISSKKFDTAKTKNKFVEVMTALPFSSKDFIKYTKNQLPIIKQRLIEKHFISKGLSTAIK